MKLIGNKMAQEAIKERRKRLQEGNLDPDSIVSYFSTLLNLINVSVK